MRNALGPRVLYKNALALATMDDQRTVVRNGDLLIEGPQIREVGSGIKPDDTTRVVDVSGKVILPGFVNTHHHLYQTLCRNIPRVQDTKLFDWLTDLYQIWRHLSPEAVYVSALVGLAELALTGCTTVADHFYVYPQQQPGTLLDRTAEAAQALGMRLCLTRGSMSRGKSRGGLPPDDVVQSEPEILDDCVRVIEKFHNPQPLSLCRVALAPCSPFSVTTELLAQTAALARKHGVRLHTHLCETKDEELFCIDKHCMRPLAYMKEVGWLGADVWFAHGVYFNDEEIEELGRTATGVAHCPTSNLRLGSGIARVPRLREAGVPVGLAVDGSASNDSSDMLAEVRMAMMVHRVSTGVESMSAVDALWLATRGGAQVLGRDDIGSLEQGKAADFSIWDMQDLAYAGGLHDPVAALVFCNGRQRAYRVVIHGQPVVERGHLVALDERDLAQWHNELAADMVEKAHAESGVDFLAPRIPNT